MSITKLTVFKYWQAVEKQPVSETEIAFSVCAVERAPDGTLSTSC